MNLPRDFVSGTDIVYTIVWRLGASVPWQVLIGLNP